MMVLKPDKSRRIVTPLLLALGICLVSFSGNEATAQAFSAHDAGVFLEEGNRIRIREVVSLQAVPDTVYLLMKVESEAATLAQVLQDKRKQVQGFIAALDQLGVQSETVRIKNFVVTPLMAGSGISLSRNLVIPLEGIPLPSNEWEGLTARIQDLGARYGSHCITCIGSG